MRLRHAQKSIKELLIYYPEKLEAKAVGQIALENGLVIYPASGVIDGVRGDIITLLPPLIISRQNVDELIDKLDKTFSEVKLSLYESS